MITYLVSLLPPDMTLGVMYLAVAFGLAFVAASGWLLGQVFTAWLVGTYQKWYTRVVWYIKIGPWFRLKRWFRQNIYDPDYRR